MWKNYLVAPVGSNEKTYDYLYACATDVVERERHESNRRSRQNREYDVGRFHYSNKNNSIRESRESRQSSSRRIPRTSERRSLSRTRRNPRNTSNKSRDSRQFCRFYLLGKCDKGKDCEYRHSKRVKAEVLAVNPIAAPPFNAGPVMDSSHPRYRSSPCNFLTTTGYCRHGDKCTYSHDLKRFGNSGIKPNDARSSTDTTKQYDNRKGTSFNSQGKHRSRSRSAGKNTPRGTPRGNPRGTPNGTPRGKFNKGTYGKKSTAAGAVAELAESPTHSVNTPKSEYSDSESLSNSEPTQTESSEHSSYSSSVSS